MHVFGLYLCVAIASFCSARCDSSAWQPCPLYTDRAALFAVGCRLDPVQPTKDALCANLDVPLHYDTPKSQSIAMFAKLIPAPKRPAEGSLVLLNGGPGGGGMIMECLISDLQNLTNGRLDIVLPEHRGVARSSGLNCGNTTDQLQCLKFAVGKYTAEYLSGFTVTNAAHDIHTLLSMLPPSHGKRYLYGVSYGTYLAQRYLQLYPHEMDAVVLDGVCSPDLTRLTFYDYGVDAAGSVFLSECGQDPTCRANMGPFPVHSFHLFFELIRSGEMEECFAKVGLKGENATVISFQIQFGIMIEDPVHRLAIAPLVKRFLRCNDQDVAQLKIFWQSAVVFGEQEVQRVRIPSLRLPASPLNNLIDDFILGFHIGQSELRDFHAQGVQQTTIREQLLSFAVQAKQISEVLMSELAQAGSPWPTYKPDPSLYSKFPNTSIPILAMTGTMDPQTPSNWLLRTSRVYNRLNQHIVHIPSAVHASTFPGRSTLRSGGPECGTRMAASFFESNGNALDQSCIQDLIPVDYAGQRNETKLLSEALFGTPDLWA